MRNPSLSVTSCAVSLGMLFLITTASAVDIVGNAHQDAIMVSGDGANRSIMKIALVAAFSGMPTSGPQPLPVVFSDASTGDITSYAWNFGDGMTSSLRNPSHEYTAVGSYTVTLTVSGKGKSDFETKTNYIMVTNATTKIGIYKDGVWYLDTDGSGTWNAGDRAHTFGAIGWTPVLGNWNGDAKGTKIGVYKDGIWYLDWNGNGIWDAGTDKVYTFGAPGWTPVVGDWNGNRTTKIGVYKDGSWYLDDNGNGEWNSGDKGCLFPTQLYTQPVVGDWNGDGKSKIGFYRWGFWSLDYLGEGKYSKFSTPFFGQQFDYVSTPVVGDWNGNEKTKIGVYQSTNGVWYLDNDGSGTWTADDRANTFGAPGWIPIVGEWN